MGFQAITKYERNTRLRHILYLLLAASVTVVFVPILTNIGILPQFAPFIPPKLPQGRYFRLLIDQREFLPAYIHLVGFLVLLYCVFVVGDVFLQRRALSHAKSVVEANLKLSRQVFDQWVPSQGKDPFFQQMKRLPTQLKENSLISSLSFLNKVYTRTDTLAHSLDVASGENISQINDRLSSLDFLRHQTNYNSIHALVKILIILGPLGSIMGVAITAIPVVNANLGIDVFVSHITDNLYIAAYTIGLGIGLFILTSIARHLEERFLIELDSFFLTEIIQKAPFKNSDTFFLLETYFRSIRNVEKSLKEELSRINKRLDYFLRKKVE